MRACSVAQSCLTLCSPVDCSPPGFPVRGIFQARILEWVAISYSRGFSDPGIEPKCLMSPALAGGFFTTSATGADPNNVNVSGKTRRKYFTQNSREWLPIT